MNCKKLFLPILIVYLLSINNHYAAAEKRAVLVDSFEARQIVRKHIDEVYPNIDQVHKRNIIIRSHLRSLSYDINVTNTISVELSYKGEPTLTVYITIDRTTGEIIDYTPWNYSGLIHEYECAIKRENLNNYVRPVYTDWLSSVTEKFPEKVETFIQKYGDSFYDFNNMILEYEYVSPLNIGSPNKKPYWRAFIAHPLDTHPISHAVYNNWLTVSIDAFSGEIIDVSESVDMLTINSRLE